MGKSAQPRQQSSGRRVPPVPAAADYRRGDVAAQQRRLDHSARKGPARPLGACLPDAPCLTPPRRPGRRPVTSITCARGEKRASLGERLQAAAQRVRIALDDIAADLADEERDRGLPLVAVAAGQIGVARRQPVDEMVFEQEIERSIDNRGRALSGDRRDPVDQISGAERRPSRARIFRMRRRLGVSAMPSSRQGPAPRPRRPCRRRRSHDHDGRGELRVKLS